MLTCKSLNFEQAQTYFEKTAEYYTKNMTNYDRWHGNLAAALGMTGECSKEQFDEVLNHIKENGRERAGVDCAFSAPKSVSLATAADEKTRADMIASHQNAVAKIAEEIELRLLQTRSNGKTHQTTNMIAAEFLHEMARPTEQNNYVPDLDLHGHLTVLNATNFDGKDLSLDYEKLMSDDNQKLFGLMYRQELAAELQKRGYELEITDEKNGFFELAGFDRETILEYSNRRREILSVAAEHGITDMQKANQFSRQTKSKGKADLDEVRESVKKELFESGKIVIKREEEHYGNDRNEADEIAREYAAEIEISDGRNFELNGGAENPFYERHISDITDFGNDERFDNKIFAERHRLPHLSERSLAQKQSRTNVLLPPSELSRLAKLTERRIRNRYLRQENEKRRRLERENRPDKIQKIGHEAIKKLSMESLAFTALEARKRIMAAGILEGITEDEAKDIMEREKLISLGHLKDKGRPSKDNYLTTAENLKNEKTMIARMKNGKNTMDYKILNAEQSKRALDLAEARAKAREEENSDFSIAGGEQGAALHHILTSHDKYIAIQGQAGTGKTTLMQRLKWIADEQEITVLGMCATGKAADGLQAESGINSSTIHAFLNKLESGKFNEPTPEERVKTAAAELATEVLTNGRPPRQTAPTPERIGKDAVKRAGRELAAETFLSGKDLAEEKKKLRAEDRELYYEQERERQAPQGIKNEWDFSSVQKCQGREIWVLDEAGLIASPLMHQIMTAAEARGAQVVLSGDVDQLPAVGAGEPMKTLLNEGISTTYLEDIRRQKDNAELLAAVKESVSGDHLKTFERLDSMGDYHEIKDNAERRAYIMKEMSEGVAVKDYKENLLLVSTNADRQRYNRDIREIFVKRGELEQGEQYKIKVQNGDKTYTEARHFSANDRIIFTANDNKVGVKNGTLAVIDRIDGNTITAITDQGKTVIWDMDKYNSVDHAYAVTNYKAQGMSVGTKEKSEEGIEVFRGKVVCDMSTTGKRQDRNALYVDISRAKTHAIVVTDDKKKLEHDTRDFAQKVTFKDFDPTKQKAYHAPEVNNREQMEKLLDNVRRHTAPPPPPSVERVPEKPTLTPEQKRAELNKTAEKILNPQKTEEIEHVLSR